MRKCLEILIAALFFTLLSGSSCNASADRIPDCSKWKSLETEYVILKYQSTEDLKHFHERIAYSPKRWRLKSLLNGSGSKSLSEKAGNKIDAMYERVQKILGMHKKGRRVTIIVHGNKEQLRDSYVKICNLSPLAYGHSPVPRAFYIYTFNTIYINVDDLHDGMLAHEMAHAIVDNFIRFQPPEPTAEILARYVDEHLFD